MRLYNDGLGEGITSKTQALAPPFVVNAAFAIELYLKTLAQVHGGRLRGHSLSRLYASLPDVAKAVIEDQRARKAIGAGTSVGIPTILHDAAEAFIEWRYSYENKRTAIVRPSLLVFTMKVLYDSCLASGKI